MAPDLASSGSKRKRQAIETSEYHSYSEAEDLDDHTPKRSRPSNQQSDVSASEGNSNQQRRLVRKKGSRNLSNLNLRHAAKTQTQRQTYSRESKFQEGSLTDRPSEQPPSLYTRLTRGHNRHPAHVDELLDAYHDGKEDVPVAEGQEQAIGDAEDRDTGIAAPKKEDIRGFFQFGRHFPTSFNPISLWKSIWSQTKEEIAREDMAKEAEKARIKAEAEARYAQMKETGQLGLQLVEFGPLDTRLYVEPTSTPQDSAFAVDDRASSHEASRNTSAATVLRPLQHDEDEGSFRDSGADPPTSVTKSLRDRFHLKRPSLSNLKRMRSDISLNKNRESSSSISPLKNAFGFSALKHSTSKIDLTNSASRGDLKKQNKLSKRVSDLESKLQQARKELDEALVEASPMPRLSGNYERFTPSIGRARPKFVPGQLPSLPSERILMAEQDLQIDGEDWRLDEVRPRKSTQLSFDRPEYEAGSEDEETIRASRARAYPRRAASLFGGSQDNDLDLTVKETQASANTVQPTQNITETNENMDPNSTTDLSKEAASQSAPVVDYATLDAKLKALDANVKTARRLAKPRKRKSTGVDEDKLFRPGRTESDEDEEYQEGSSKKKRKSNGENAASPPAKRAARTTTQGSPAKKGMKAAPKSNGPKSSPTRKPAAKKTVATQSEEQHAATKEGYSADEASGSIDFRASVNSQAPPLDPVYEEEEDREPGTDEEVMTRAARAAQQHPGRRGGSRDLSLSPAKTVTTQTTIVEESVPVVPGKDGVPQLPKGANGSFESLDRLGVAAADVEILRAAGQTEKTEKFEWPEDVF